MRRIKIQAAFCFLSIFIACAERHSNDAALYEAPSTLPKKPNALPQTPTKFNDDHINAVKEAGTTYCTVMEAFETEYSGVRKSLSSKIAAQVAAEIKLSSKLCGEGKVFTGYNEDIGIQGSNEIFIANKKALFDAFSLGSNAAAAMKSVRARQILLEMQIAQDDLSETTEGIQKAFEKEVLNPQGGPEIVAKSRGEYLYFCTWIGQVNNYFRINDKPK